MIFLVATYYSFAGKSIDMITYNNFISSECQYFSEIVKIGLSGICTLADPVKEAQFDLAISHIHAIF